MADHLNTPGPADLMEAVPAPMLMLDQDGTVIAANAAASGLLGDWIIGRNHASVLRQPSLLALIERAMSKGQGGEARFVQSEPTGQVIFEAEVTVIGAGQRRCVIVHFTDISHLKDVEDMRRDFVANVSHELRTPLTAILGFIETLRGPARSDRDAQERFLGIMEDEARRMNRIVSDLLSLSRVEGQERMRPDAPVDLTDLLRSVAATLGPQAAESDIKIVLEGIENECIVRGDADQLMQVFVNLAENALKYGGAGKEVTLRLGQQVGLGAVKGPVARVEVIDRGDGIDPIHLPRLTERFYRVDTHRSRAMGGTGLGLAIVKHIVNRHRGRLRVESTRGEGSVFTVLLPMG